MKNKGITRRSFISKSVTTTGLASVAPLGIMNGLIAKPGIEKLPREVWICGVSQMGLRAATPEKMTDAVLDILREAAPFSPDVVCLPEVFPFAYVDKKTTLQEKVEISQKVIELFASFSRENNCYTVCPCYTTRNGNIYNSAVVLDRAGKRAGSYEKIHLPENEINEGLTCGPLFQPVILTDFGTLGVQICFDIEWDDGWSMLRKQGAEIIFWPSAFAGGRAVNTKAWQHKCFVATATNKNSARLCDISGEIITQTGIWNPNLYCGSVNLEKLFLHTWPSVNRFDDIRRKYGRRIRITTFHEEEWTIIESLSAEIKVRDVLDEFGLQTHEELTGSVEKLQAERRK